MSGYDDNVKIWKDAYTEIKNVCEKYATEFDNKYGFYDVRTMLNEANAHLRQIEILRKYRELNVEDKKKRDIEKLEAQLEKLKS